MAVTQTKICNSALIKVGSDPITSISQDTKRANLLDRIWEQVRDAVMSAHPWNFAIKRDTLSPNASEPDWGYDYQYDIPNDCLRILTVDPEDIDFVIEDGQILTDESELDILYIYRNTNESSWSPLFAEALAWKLAHEIAYALTQNSKVREDCEKGYKAVMSEARTMDGAEGVLKGLEADTWTLARR